TCGVSSAGTSSRPFAASATEFVEEANDVSALAFDRRYRAAVLRAVGRNGAVVLHRYSRRAARRARRAARVVRAHGAKPRRPRRAIRARRAAAAADCVGPTRRTLKRRNPLAALGAHVPAMDARRTTRLRGTRRAPARSELDPGRLQRSGCRRRVVARVPA